MARTTKTKSMSKWLSLLTALMLMLAAFAAMSGGTSYAQNDSRTFTETGKTVKGKFLVYWNEHGGLAQQGLPISEEMQEKSDLNGKTYTVQYFERAVFEGCVATRMARTHRQQHERT